VSLIEDLLKDVCKDSPAVLEMIRAYEEDDRRRARDIEEARRRIGKIRRNLKPDAAIANAAINNSNGRSRWGKTGGLSVIGFGEAEQGEVFIFDTGTQDAGQPEVSAAKVEVEKSENPVVQDLTELAFSRYQHLQLLNEFAGEGGHFVTIDGHAVFISDTRGGGGGLRAGQTTKQAYFNNKTNRYRADREKIHEDTAEGYLLGKHAPTDRKPIAYVLGGGTASGKTSASKKIIGEDSNIVRIDPDELKLAIPEYEDLKKSDNANAAMRVHDESKEITKQLIQRAVAKGVDLTYDATTSGKAGPVMIDTFLKHGYDVRVNFVDLPVEEALKRGVMRAQGDNPINKGRIVPEKIYYETHQESAQRFQEIKDKPGITSVKLYDNSQPQGHPPTLVYERNNIIGAKELGTEVVHNEPRWQQYLRKSRGELE
jgi:predicted ABC-type ATPase